MFTWICPKCGKEVPPAYSECPNCGGTGKQLPTETLKPVPLRHAAPPPAPPRTEAPPTEAAPPPAPVPPPRAAVETPPPAPVAPPPAQKSASLPGWAMTLLFAAAFIAIGFGLLTFFRSRPAQDNAQAAPSATDSPRLPDPAAVKAHPVLKSLELTGLRLTEDAKQKATLSFVLVNHSSADLPGLAGRANLVAVNAKPGDAPMGSFAFKTDLGPYQAKDIKVPVNTKLRAYELPDWQFLRADLEITAP